MPGYWCTFGAEGSGALLKAWPGYSPHKTHPLEKLVKSFRWSTDKLATLQNSRVMSILAFPFTLPKIHNKEISDDLMHKILRDGFDAHADEIRLALRSQTKIDAYNTFKRIYSASVMGTVMVTYLMSDYDQVTEEMNRNAQHQDELLNSLSNEIDALTEIRLTIIEQAYQGVKTLYASGKPAVENPSVIAKIMAAATKVPNITIETDCAATLTPTTARLIF